MATENVDSEGDVTLVVGDEKKKIRVDSHCMRKGSEVFNAMFSARFAEGLELSSTSPKDIDLLEGDYESMPILCNVFHFRNDKIPEILSSTSILAVAYAADKYGCSGSLIYAKHEWF